MLQIPNSALNYNKNLENGECLKCVIKNAETIAFEILLLHNSLWGVFVWRLAFDFVDIRFRITKMILCLAVAFSSTMLVCVKASFHQYKEMEVDQSLWQPLNTFSGKK